MAWPKGVSRKQQQEEVTVAEVKKGNEGGVKIDAGVGECPWCNYDNKDEKVGEVHARAKSNIVVANGSMEYQCLTCGKNWNREQLGKPWSLELERGEAWERENRARQLKR